MLFMFLILFKFLKCFILAVREPRTYSSPSNCLPKEIIDSLTSLTTSASSSSSSSSAEDDSSESTVLFVLRLFYFEIYFYIYNCLGLSSNLFYVSFFATLESNLLV